VSGTRRGRNWFDSHRRDPYVRRAWAEGQPSRAGYKLAEIDRRERLLRPGLRVLDLGAAPGSWTRYAAERVGPGGRVTAVDLVPFPAPPGARVLVRDVTDVEGLLAALAAGDAAGARVDLILSDLAPKLSGVRERDQEALAALGRAATALARALLRPNGALLLKTFHGEGGNEVRAGLAGVFADVKVLKPSASRSESSEHYLLARKVRIV